MSEEFKWFNPVIKQWVPIPGKVYRANLPISLDFPNLGPLIVHRNVGGYNVPKDKTWVVTHKETSFAIARGPTRAKAVKNAQDVLLYQGAARVDRAIELAKEQIAFLASRPAE